MGYSIAIESTIYSDNYTFNVAEMYQLAFDSEEGIKYLNDETCGNAIIYLKDAINAMKEYKGKFLPLEPNNGWGDYEGALSVLEDLLIACEESNEFDIVRVEC